MPRRRTLTASAVLVLLLSAPFGSAVARAEASLIRQAQQAEQAGHPKEALALYEAEMQAHAGPAAERIARVRMAWIEERREDDYRPLSELLRLRAIPAAALTRAELNAFESILVGLPQGPLRMDGRAFVADAWLTRLSDPVEAERATRAWLTDPFPDKGTREMATDLLARVIISQGHTAAALKLLQSAGYGKDQLYLEMRPRRVSEIGRPIAFIFLGVFALLAAFVLATRLNLRVARVALQPSTLLAAVYVILIPCIVGCRFMRPMTWTIQHSSVYVAVALLVSLFTGAALREKPLPRGWVVLIAISAALACLSAGFLGFDRSEMIEELLRWRGV